MGRVCHSIACNANKNESCCRFVFCRQRQDEKLRRGGEQKSVVVLSQQPYSSALIPLAQYAGPLYFNIGKTALEEVSIQAVDGTLAASCRWLMQLPVAFACLWTQR